MPAACRTQAKKKTQAVRDSLSPCMARSREGRGHRAFFKNRLRAAQTRRLSFFIIPVFPLLFKCAVFFASRAPAKKAGRSDDRCGRCL